KNFLIVLAQLIDPDDRDDAFERVVLVEMLDDLLGNIVMTPTDDREIQIRTRTLQWINGRIHTALNEITRENDATVEIRKDRDDRGIGHVIGRNVNGLERGDRSAALDGTDAFLDRADLGGKCRLISGFRRNTA